MYNCSFLGLSVFDVLPVRFCRFSYLCFWFCCLCFAVFGFAAFGFVAFGFVAFGFAVFGFALETFFSRQRRTLQNRPVHHVWHDRRVVFYLLRTSLIAPFHLRIFSLTVIRGQYIHFNIGLGSVILHFPANVVEPEAVLGLGCYCTIKESLRGAYPMTPPHVLFPMSGPSLYILNVWLRMSPSDPHIHW